MVNYVNSFTRNKKYYCQVVIVAFCIKVKEIDADPTAKTDADHRPAIHVVVVIVRIVGRGQCAVVCSYNVIAT